VGNRYGQALSQYNLGVCSFHRGRYAEALEHLRAARGIHEFLGDTQGLAQTMNMEAELYLSLGDSGRAAARLEDSAAALPDGESGGYTTADRLLLEAELTLRTGRLEAARKLCRRAGDLFTSLGDTRQQARTALVASRCLAARGLVREAEEALERARTKTRQMDAPRLRAELVLAESELRCDFDLGPTHDQCASSSRALLDELAEVDDPDLLQAIQAALGRHLEQTGHQEEAMVAFRGAFDLLRKVANRFGSRHLGWKSSYLQQRRRAEVVRKVAEWSQKINPPDPSRRG
jgi:tetratricopeptide (TPR) repeat protein